MCILFFADTVLDPCEHPSPIVVNFNPLHPPSFQIINPAPQVLSCLIFVYSYLSVFLEECLGIDVMGTLVCWSKRMKDLSPKSSPDSAFQQIGIFLSPFLYVSHGSIFHFLICIFPKHCKSLEGSDYTIRLIFESPMEALPLSVDMFGEPYN